MNLDQLRIFVAVGQMEHFTRAAERLGVNQSVVSSVIAALEAEHSVSLFHRSRRQVELTAAGNLLLEEAEAILARVDLARRRMTDLSGLRRGELCIGASQTVANYWLPPRLHRFQERHPGVTVNLVDGNSTEVEKMVAKGMVDLGIIEQDAGNQTLEVETIAADQLLAVVGPDHPWFGRDDVGWPDVLETGWVMREIGSGTRALFEAALAGHGILPEALNVPLTLRTGEAVLHAVLAGPHAAVVSRLVADVGTRAGLLHRVTTLSIDRTFEALTLPGRYLPNTAIAFRDMIRVEWCPADANTSAAKSISKSDSFHRLPR